MKFGDWILFGISDLVIEIKKMADFPFPISHFLFMSLL